MLLIGHCDCLLYVVCLRCDCWFVFHGCHLGFVVFGGLWFGCFVLFDLYYLVVVFMLCGLLKTLCCG